MLCFTKIPRGNVKRKRDEQWDVIEKFVVSGLDRTDSRLPKVLCLTCSIYLNQYSNGIFERKIKLFDHSSITGSPILTKNHTCTVCEIGSKSNFHCSKPKKGRPHSVESEIEAPTPVKVCSFCFSKLAKGKSHVCTQTTREFNILKAVQVRFRLN